MDYRAVLQEQIRELQKLQDENLRSGIPMQAKIENAIALAEQIRKIYVDVKRPLD